jgi:histidinol phosphatase-like PHP family hydrolase
MTYKIDYDLHIHSKLSLCSSDPEQTVENILNAAKANRLSTVCITDHYWDSAVAGASDWYRTQNFEHIASALPLPSVDGVRALFGCETDLDRNFTLGIPPSRFSDFDFIIIPTFSAISLFSSERGFISFKNSFQYSVTAFTESAKGVLLHFSMLSAEADA